MKEITDWCSGDKCNQRGNCQRHYDWIQFGRVLACDWTDYSYLKKLSEPCDAFIEHSRLGRVLDEVQHSFVARFQG
jgi:hypothetical protein